MQKSSLLLLTLLYDVYVSPFAKIIGGTERDSSRHECFDANLQRRFVIRYVYLRHSVSSGELGGSRFRYNPRVRELSPELLKLLVCPRCHGELQEGVSGLTCSACRLLYPIEDGIPVMMIDRATPLQ